jgi:regulator of replication initiation timing
LQEALAKLSAAQVALEDASKLAASRGSQVEALSTQLDALKASVANMGQEKQAGADVAGQLAQRDATIKVRTAEEFMCSMCSVLVVLPSAAGVSSMPCCLTTIVRTVLRLLPVVGSVCICLQETRKQLESAQSDNSRLTAQLASLKKQLEQAAAAPATSSKQVQEVQAQAAQLVEKVSAAGLLTDFGQSVSTLSYDLTEFDCLELVVQ